MNSNSNNPNRDKRNVKNKSTKFLSSDKIVTHFKSINKIQYYEKKEIGKNE